MQFPTLFYSYGIMFFVVGLDLVLRYTAIYLFMNVGYDTYSELMSKIVNGVFIVLFLNTGIILVLVQANFSDITIRMSLFDGPYYDYSPKWYSTVGSTLVYKMLLASVMPPFYEFIVRFLVWF